MNRHSGTSNEIPGELPALVGRIMRQQDGKWCWTLNEKFTSVEWKSDGTPALMRGEFSGAMFLASGKDCETYDEASLALKQSIEASGAKNSPKVKAVKEAIEKITEWGNL